MEPDRYRFREEVLRTAASRTRRRLLVGLGAAIAAATAMWAGVLRPRGAGGSTLAFAVALLGILALLSLRRRLRRLVARWSSFQVTLDADAVAREVEGFPPIRIARSEVASIEERPEGVVVRSVHGAALLVPRELDGYERARDALARWTAAVAPPAEG